MIGPIDCAHAETLLAEHAMVRGDLPKELADHLAACDSCLRLARELDNPVVAEALEEAARAVEDLDDLTVVPRENYVRGAEIGRGGMGRIVRAHDRRLGRAVAIKELIDDRLRARFEREARLTARLQHPAIVNVHEAGCWPSGEPFYAMKYVAGRPLDQVIESAQSLEERLALLPNFITVVEAVAYAHSVKIIHRDLKPANILLGPFGETVVIDWGLAKDLGKPASEPLADGGPYRSHGDAVTQGGAGTLRYMPPEQVAEHIPDERLDVYALGATLYHVLAGHEPYGELRGAEVLELARTSGPAPLADVEPRVPRALRAIVTKAMAREPARRYATAGELAADLKRFQSGQFVAAHHYTVGERAGRFYRRHRAVVTLAAVSLVCLSTVGAVSVANVVRAKHRAEAQLGLLLLERGQRELLAHAPSRALIYLSEALQRGVDTPALRFVLAEASRPTESLEASFPIDTVRPATARFSPDARRLVTSGSDGVRLLEMPSGRLLASLQRHAASALVFRADGKRLLTASLSNLGDAGDPAVRMWDPEDGRLVALLPHAAPVAHVGFDAGGMIVSEAGAKAYLWHAEDGRLRTIKAVSSGIKQPDLDAALAARGSDSTTAVVGTGLEARTLDHGALIVAVRRSVDGGAVATVGADGTVRVWDAATGAERGTFDGQTAPLLDAALTSDGSRLFVAGSDGSAKVWRTDRHLLWVEATKSPVRRAVFAADGRLLVVDENGDAEVLDAGRGTIVARTSSHLRPGDAATFLRDGRVLLDDFSTTPIAWDLNSGDLDPVMALPRVPVTAVIDGGAILLDRKGMLYGKGHVPFAAVGGDHLALAPDGFHVVGLRRGSGFTVGVWDARTGRLVRSLPVEFGPTLARDEFLLAPRGNALAVMAADRQLQVWDSATGARVATITSEIPIEEAHWSRDGERLLVLAQGVGIWSAQGRPLAVLRAPAGTLTTGAFSPDGARVLTGARTGLAQVWDAESGELLGTLGQLPAAVDTVSFSPDGRRAFVGAGPHRSLWDVHGDARPPAAVAALAERSPYTFDGVRVVSRAVRSAELSSDPASVERARAHFHAGEKLMADGRMREAAMQFGAAYQETPWTGYLFYAGISYGGAGDAENASQNLERYLALGGDIEDGDQIRQRLAALREGGPTMSAAVMRELFDQGQEHYANRRYEEAAQAFLRAALSYPSPTNFFNAAVCYEKMHDNRIAIALFKRYLRLMPAAKDAEAIESRIEALSRSLAGTSPTR